MSDRGTDREDEIRQSWEANAGAWAQVVREQQIESRRLATDAAILAALERYAPGRVLDVGCGEGWLARRLSGQGVEVVGVDGSRGLIEQARALGGGTFHVLGYEDVIARPERLGGPFDGIVCNFALLGETLAPLLTALRTQLASSGHLFIQTVHPHAAGGDPPYADGWRTETFSSFGGGFTRPMPWYFRTPESWLRLVEEAGFRLVERREPAHPATERPLSLILICRAEADPRGS